jgi:hypothetical protein
VKGITKTTNPNPNNRYKKKKKNEDPNNSSVERSFSGTTRNTNHDFQFHTPNNVTQPATIHAPKFTISVSFHSFIHSFLKIVFFF